MCLLGKKPEPTNPPTHQNQPWGKETEQKRILERLLKFTVLFGSLNNRLFPCFKGREGLFGWACNLSVGFFIF